MPKRDSARQWRERMARWRQSGTTIAEFCRHEGVSKTAFYGWRRKLDAEPASAAMEFIQVAPPAIGGVIELEVGDVVVRLRPGFEASDLRAVLTALGWSPR